MITQRLRQRTSRARELEEARQLQLSMLPRSLPDVAAFDIAAFMKPALKK